MMIIFKLKGKYKKMYGVCAQNSKLTYSGKVEVQTASICSSVA